MTTKKQRREACLKKREEEMEELRRSGLEAQRIDRARRANELRKEWQDVHDKKHHKFVDECPICNDIRLAQRRKNGSKAITKVAKARAST